MRVGWMHVYYLRSSGRFLGSCPGLVDYNNTENGECGEELNRRTSYDSTGEEKSVRERYNRLEAITNAAVEGNKNSCVIERHKKPAASAIRSKKQDIRRQAQLTVRAGSNSINMLSDWREI
jgi:hypothetical protein